MPAATSPSAIPISLSAAPLHVSRCLRPVPKVQALERIKKIVARGVQPPELFRPAHQIPLLQSPRQLVGLPAAVQFILQRSDSWS